MRKIIFLLMLLASFIIVIYGLIVSISMLYVPKSEVILTCSDISFRMMDFGSGFGTGIFLLLVAYDKSF